MSNGIILTNREITAITQKSPKEYRLEIYRILKTTYFSPDTKEKDLRILPGEKLVQIVPFKRDNWEMTLKSERMYSQLFHYIRGAYTKLFRSEKVYK